MPTVYVVQEPQVNWETGESRRDFSAAESYGTIKFLLPPGILITDDIGTELLDAGLDKWRAEDYLLCSGHPVAIGVATALVAMHGKPVKLLVWLGRRQQRYTVITYNSRWQLRAAT